MIGFKGYPQTHQMSSDISELVENVLVASI